MALRVNWLPVSREYQGGNDGAKRAAKNPLASTCPLVNEKGHANDKNQICCSQIADVDIWGSFLLSSENN